MKKKKEEDFRAFVDLNVNGNAKGGVFIGNDLKDAIEDIEEKGVDKVVGVVYDGTYKLEILTKPLIEIETDIELNQKGVKI